MTMRWMLVLLVLAAGCARCGDPADADDLFGVQLYVEPSALSEAYCADYLRAPDFRERVRQTLEATALHFGHEPRELAGLRLVLHNGVVSCPGVDNGILNGGCLYRGTITVNARVSKCLEGTSLSHELLHYFIGDPGHTDPRWADLKVFVEQLRADNAACAGPC